MPVAAHDGSRGTSCHYAHAGKGNFELNCDRHIVNSLISSSARVGEPTRKVTSEMPGWQAERGLANWTSLALSLFPFSRTQPGFRGKALVSSVAESSASHQSIQLAPSHLPHCAAC